MDRSFLVMPSDLSISTAGRASQRTISTSFLGLGNRLGTHSPEDVFQNAWAILKGHRYANTSFGKVITAVIAIGMLVTAVDASRSRYAVLETCVYHAWQYWCQKMYVSVRVPDSVPLYGQTLHWMASKGIGMNNRTLVVGASQGAALPRAGSLLSVPNVGKYTFHNPLSMTVEIRPIPLSKVDPEQRGLLTDDMDQVRNEFIVSTWRPFGGSKRIEDFLVDIPHTSVAHAEARITIYRPDWRYGGEQWDIGITRAARDIDSVVLDEDVKTRVVEDFKTYLSPKTRAEYIKLGIPWRRGLLFYGPPGTGKTSLVTALASEFALDIYILDLSSGVLNDWRLARLFEQLPPNCIVLLEDIDGYGVAGAKKGKKKGARSRKRDDEVTKAEGITRGGLINTLDGVNAAEGRITIMTTNFRERLDKALIRDGRVDLELKLGHASPEVAAKLFKRIITLTTETAAAETTETVLNGTQGVSGLQGWAQPLIKTLTPGKEAKEVDATKAPSDSVQNVSYFEGLTQLFRKSSTAGRKAEAANLTNPARDDGQGSVTRPASDGSQGSIDIDELAQEFASCIPPGKLTPAELQGYLLLHRKDASAAVQNAADWVNSRIQAKMRGRHGSLASDAGRSSHCNGTDHSSGKEA